jgi:hypothetical protein
MKNKIYFGIIIVLSLGLAAYCGYEFCTQIEIADGGISAVIGVYIASLFLSVIVVDVLHEGGHFLVGVICRMGVNLPKLSLFKSSSVEVFPKGTKGMKGRMLATTLAGCFITLLVIVVGVIALTAPSVTVIFSVALPFAFYHFAINIAPFEYNSGKTDGLVALEIIQNQPTAQVMLAILKVQGLINSGVKLEDIDEGLLLDLPQLQEDDINFIILTQLRYEYYLARGNDSEAYKYFMRYKDLVQYLPSEYKK